MNLIIRQIGISLLLLVIFSSIEFAQPPTDAQPLSIGKTVEREIKGGEAHTYSIPVSAGQYIRIIVDQRSADVVLALFREDGKKLMEVDSPNGTSGLESLSVIAETTGTYRLVIESLDKGVAPGRYEVKLEELRKSTEKDRERVAGERALANALKLSTSGSDESLNDAIKNYEEALAYFQRVGDRGVEALILQSLGDAYSRLGWKEKAVDYFAAALSIVREQKDRNSEGRLLVRMGVIYFELVDVRTALEFFNRALLLFRDVKNLKEESITLILIGGAYSVLNQNQKALSYISLALEGFRKVGDPYSEMVAILGIGAAYRSLGKKLEAVKYFNEALSISMKIADKRAEGMILSNLGDVYDDLGEREKALRFYDEALLNYRYIKDIYGEAETLSKLAVFYSVIDEKARALEYLNRALQLFRSLSDKEGEIDVLTSIGKIYQAAGDIDKAQSVLDQARLLGRDNAVPAIAADPRGKKDAKPIEVKNVAPTAKEIQDPLIIFSSQVALSRQRGDKASEASALTDLMFHTSALRNPRLAIAYGKSAVNLYQEIRFTLKDKDIEWQEARLRSANDAYRKLADILIAEGRLIEAENVLEMLKEEEVAEYIGRDASELEKFSNRADISPQELEALKRFKNYVDKIAEIGKKQSEVANRLTKPGKTSGRDQRSYDELSDKLDDASRVFDVFLRHVGEEFSEKQAIVEDIRKTGFKSDVKNWGDNSVFLHTLVGRNRYRVIITTPETQTDGKTEITEAYLNDKIEEFRNTIKEKKDTKVIGKELYDILIKPIEQQLKGAEAKTILWSLDGNLRLLPIAALWDGEQYFGQKYRNVVITLASRSRLSEKPAATWRALGFGVTRAQTIKEPNGTRALGFEPLENVKTELLSIIRDEDAGENGEKGVLPGKRLFDSDFTLSEMKKMILKGYKVVHIASHFSVRPGDSTKSFILLGDGTALTVDQFKNSAQLRFDGVELLTLSACQTALVEKDGKGREMEGLGYVAQINGAKAILASLWKVNDESTSRLMTQFYTIRERDKLSKAEALQNAQLDLINSREFSHPYYWAPFILIGNWR
ncbi:MAG TPA: CHAT domain-containing protein [Pyrinomonadaceae bacterium]|jgi:CHAT domain-containing protein/tetratricopeptide (TPR) repeat protein|nr:CHAT domain-containing protein [Pyrinomonadaceae bacterium]